MLQVPGWAAGLLDDLAMQLSGRQRGSRGGVLGFQWQQRSACEMALLDAIGMFMAYTEEKPRTDLG